MSPVQVALSILTVAALVYTVVAYPHKYRAVSGRSRLFRTVGIFLLDLLFLLVLMETFINFHTDVSPRVAALRFVFYNASCYFLCFSLLCVAALDSLESYSSVRRERRAEVDRTLREEIEKAREEARLHKKVERQDESGPSD